MAEDKTGKSELLALQGEDLKTSLKRLSKGPMRFAFGFNDRQKPILLMHKTKTPQALQNDLKTKLRIKNVTHGTAKADGKALVLDVEGKPIPTMDKMVKVLLRKEKVGKYTDAVVNNKPAETEGGPAVKEGAPLDRLRLLQTRIQFKEADLGAALRGIKDGSGDSGVVSEYRKLVVEFAQEARGCEDRELLAFGKSAVDRAKKLDGVLKQGEAGATAGTSDAGPAPASNLTGSVGKGGANKAPDVKLVQELLNGHGASLEVDGKSGPKTVKAIASFQKEKLGFLDGRVDPGGKTWAALNGRALPGSAGAGGAGATGAPGVPGAPGATGTSEAPGAGTTEPAAGSVEAAAGAGGDKEIPDYAQVAAAKAKAKSDPLQGAGVEVGWGDRSVGIKKSKDGTVITLKHEEDIPLFATNFQIWVIPCYTKGAIKGALAGEISIGKKDGAALQATGTGSLELGVGRTSDVLTVGAYGSVALSATNSCSVSYTEKDGVDIQPFTFTLKGSGQVGIKAEVKDGPKVDVNQELFDWELFVIHVGRYTKDKFESIQVKAGKDLMRLINALEQGGPKIEALVEEYAPDFAKKAAVDAAEWAAESDEAGAVADVVQEGVDYVKKKTGVDVGGGVEEIIQSLVDEHGETSAEATERFNKEMETFNASQEDFHGVIAASGLKGDLRQYRTSDEYNAIVDCWQAETELVVKGKQAPGKWRGMVEALVKTARQRRSQQQAAAQKKQKEEDDAVQAAVAAMEAARPAAQGPGNVLNNKLQKTPNAEAQKLFQQGWQQWSAAEAARKQVASSQGAARAQKAKEAKALYDQARATFQTGLQYLS